MNAVQKVMMLGARVLPQPVMQRIGMLVMKSAPVSKPDANPPTAGPEQNAAVADLTPTSSQARTGPRASTDTPTSTPSSTRDD